MKILIEQFLELFSTYLLLSLDPLSNSRHRRSSAVFETGDGFFDELNGGHCRVFL